MASYRQGKKNNVLLAYLWTIWAFHEFITIWHGIRVKSIQQSTRTTGKDGKTCWCCGCASCNAKGLHFRFHCCCCRRHGSNWFLQKTTTTSANLAQQHFNYSLFGTINFSSAINSAQQCDDAVNCWLNVWEYISIRGSQPVIGTLQKHDIRRCT